jgi:hypothetical protein
MNRRRLLQVAWPVRPVGDRSVNRHFTSFASQERTMKGFRFVTLAVGVNVLGLIGTTVGCNSSHPITPLQPTAAVQSGQLRSVSSRTATDESLSAATLAELARARDATAKYHDVAEALADGYVQRGYGPGEGFHFVNASLIDCTFDVEHPETLLYIRSGEGLRLVGVEYSVSNTCTATAPEGFTGDADEWEGPDAEGRPVWALIAWLWLANPNGVFAEPPHPQIPLVP